MAGPSFPLLLFWVILRANATPIHDMPNNQPVDNSTQLYVPRWVAGPRTRGTLGLVFSCVITLFLCVWTTVHVNIEPVNEYNPTLARFIPIPALKKNKWLLKFLAKRSIRKLGWSCVTLFIPEGIMAIAAFERKTAHLLLQAVNEIIEKRNAKTAPGEPKINKWDMSLAYYAIMGGFVIPEADYEAASDQVGKTRRHERSTGTILEPSFQPSGEIEKAGRLSEFSNLQAGRPVVETTNYDPEKQVGGNEEAKDIAKNERLTLTPYAVLQLAKWQWGPSSSLPADTGNTLNQTPDLLSINSDQVSDKSNANSLAKGLVAWQALWMIVQVIGRAANHPKLPVTLLELHTSLHTFCAFAVYLTWWNKPVDIETPTTVHLSHEQIIILQKGESNPDDPTNPWNTMTTEKNASLLPDPDHAASKKNSTPDTKVFLTSRSGIGKLLYLRLCGHKDIRKEYFNTISDAYIRLWRGRKAVWKEGLIISFVGLIFGGVHLAAWNSSFPSNVERILWQIAATVTAVAWSGFVLSLWMSVLVEERKEGRLFSKVCGIFLGVGIFPVLLVRLSLLVESFASIRRLPFGSYDLTIWSNTWPHAG